MYYDTVMHTPQARRTRDDVLDAAEDLLAREGAQGLSVRRIAQALGVSRQIVYSRFAGKPDLVRALQHEGFRRLTQQCSEVPGPSGDTRHMLAMAQAYRASALASPALYELMFGRPILEFEPDAHDRAVAAASFEPVIEACRAWLEGNGYPSSRPDALSLARRVWAATHGVVSLEAAGLLGDEAPRMIDDLVTATLAAYGNDAD
jgi:AcrR family transcriptional regulator